MSEKRVRVLVTGATGFLGRALTQRLVDLGYTVRALVRPSSNAGRLEELGVEIAIGDLSDAESVSTAARGVDVVVHAAAGTRGTAKDARTATVLGTRHVLEACRKNGVKKLVYISSCNVYEVAGFSKGELVREEAQLERYSERRGQYTADKLRAENQVTAAMKQANHSIVILRPGTIYGPRGELFTPMIGVALTKRVFLVFGDGRMELPLVHVDNTVDAIVACLANTAADNRVFNVVDEGRVTKRLYMDQVIKPMHPGAMAVYVPMSVLYAITWLQEKLLTAVGRKPFLTVYRLKSSQNRISYSTSNIRQAIGWRTRVGFIQAAEQLVKPQCAEPDPSRR